MSLLQKQSVIIFGATGNTGSIVANALIADPHFEVHIAVRPDSASKPLAKSLEEKGATLHLLDVEHTSAEEIATHLNGINTVVSCLLVLPLTKQNVLVDACALAGVKRFVPSEWATAYTRGTISIIGDQKIAVQEYIKEKNVPYTLIDVGWWMQLTLPILDSAKAVGALEVFAPFFTTRFGSGDVKSAVTDCRDIGAFVARIIADERTLNRYVFVYGEHVTQKEIIDVAEKTTGRSIDLTYRSEADVDKESAATSADNLFLKAGLDYMRSMWISGDNTIDKAKEEAYGGAIDAREYYPEVKPNSLASFAKEFYADLH